MKTKKLIDNLSGVDEKFVKEAELGQNKARRSRLIRFTALAAAIILLAVSIPVGIMIANRAGKDDEPVAVTTDADTKTPAETVGKHDTESLPTPDDQTAELPVENTTNGGPTPDVLPTDAATDAQTAPSEITEPDDPTPTQHAETPTVTEPVDPTSALPTETPAVTEPSEPTPSTPVPTETTIDQSVDSPESRIVSHGLIFAINPDQQSYSVVGVEEDADETLEIPRTVNGLPVTAFPDLLDLLINRPGLVQIGDNIIFLNNTAYILPVVDGKIDITGTGFIIDNNCLIDPETGTLLIAFDDPTIPDDGSIRTISSYAFSRCKAVNKLTIPDSVSKINPFAFYACESVYEIVFEGAVSKIGKNAFWGCENLRSVSVTGYDVWDAIEFDSLLSNPLYCGAELYVNGRPANTGTSVEPDKQTDVQAWLKWLTEDRYCAGRKYNPLALCGAYLVQYIDDSIIFNPKEAKGQPCAWEVWSEHFQMLYMLRYKDVDLNCTWEIFYRKAGTDTFNSISVNPWSKYQFGENVLGQTIYRLPTYDAGMTDIGTDNGEPQDYEFIFVIHESDVNSDIIAWCADTMTVTDSYDMWLAYAKDKGIVK